MKIEKGWHFYLWLLGVQTCSEVDRKGSVVLVRSPSEKKRWHQMSEEMKEDDDGPPLYIYHRAMTFGAAIKGANRAAAKAKPIPPQEIDK